MRLNRVKERTFKPMGKQRRLIDTADQTAYLCSRLCKLYERCRLKVVQDEPASCIVDQTASCIMDRTASCIVDQMPSRTANHTACRTAGSCKSHSGSNCKSSSNYMPTASRTAFCTAGRTADPRHTANLPATASLPVSEGENFARMRITWVIPVNEFEPVLERLHGGHSRDSQTLRIHNHRHPLEAPAALGPPEAILRQLDHGICGE
jgi:hypothetical protein